VKVQTADGNHVIGGSGHGGHDSMSGERVREELADSSCDPNAYVSQQNH
jgi:hypothetical protein